MQIDFINYPFTRILDRLLGPCFKTGPKGIPNLTAVDQTDIVLACASDAETSIISSLKPIRQSLQYTTCLPDNTHNRKRSCHLFRINFMSVPIDDPIYTWRVSISNGSRRLTKRKVHTTFWVVLNFSV